MSSPVTDDSELKAGHPPAVKIGKMRVATTHKASKEKEDATPSPESTTPVGGIIKAGTPSVVTNISGAPQDITKAYSTDAVQSFHNKPMPTHDTRHNTSKPMVIQQPRK